MTNITIEAARKWAQSVDLPGSPVRLLRAVPAYLEEQAAKNESGDINPGPATEKLKEAARSEGYRLQWNRPVSTSRRLMIRYMDRLIQLPDAAFFQSGTPDDPDSHTLEEEFNKGYQAGVDACLNKVTSMIRNGPLGGSGLDDSAERNGIVLATNAISAIKHAATEEGAIPPKLARSVEDLLTKIKGSENSKETRDALKNQLTELLLPFLKLEETMNVDVVVDVDEELNRIDTTATVTPEGSGPTTNTGPKETSNDDGEVNVLDEWTVDGAGHYRLVDRGCGPRELQLSEDGKWSSEHESFVHGVLCARIEALVKSLSLLAEASPRALGEMRNSMEEVFGEDLTQCIMQLFLGHIDTATFINIASGLTEMEVVVDPDEPQEDTGKDS